MNEKERQDKIKKALKHEAKNQRLQLLQRIKKFTQYRIKRFRREVKILQELKWLNEDTKDFNKMDLKTREELVERVIALEKLAIKQGIVINDIGLKKEKKLLKEIRREKKNEKND